MVSVLSLADKYTSPATLLDMGPFRYYSTTQLGEVSAQARLDRGDGLCPALRMVLSGEVSAMAGRQKKAPREKGRKKKGYVAPVLVKREKLSDIAAQLTISDHILPPPPA